MKTLLQCHPTIPRFPLYVFLPCTCTCVHVHVCVCIHVFLISLIIFDMSIKSLLLNFLLNLEAEFGDYYEC